LSVYSCVHSPFSIIFQQRLQHLITLAVRRKPCGHCNYTIRLCRSDWWSRA